MAALLQSFRVPIAKASLGNRTAYAAALAEGRAVGELQPRGKAAAETAALADEVEKAWGIVTPILEAWIQGPPPRFPNYEAGTWGPPEADQLIGRDGRRWRRL